MRIRHSSLVTRHSGSGWTSQLLAEARRYLVGGVNSPVRAFGAVGQEPPLLVRGKGAMVTDAQGRRLIDLIMGWGALILGHCHPRVLEAIRGQLANGLHLGLTHPAEVSLAKAITDAFASIEQVRFTNSGTEACMTGIRLARAFTKRSKILAFEGCYHGHSDGLLVRRKSSSALVGLAASAGIPEAIAQETLVVAYNDLEAADGAFRRFGEDIACAIVEPVCANMGVVLPDLRFLRGLRKLTEQHGALLIFDEVVTGFRATYGGLQNLFGIRPDLTVLGKIIGGGLPIGAIGGMRHLMQQLAPEGPVYHAGTFAGHPVAMVAGLATLNELKKTSSYEYLKWLAARLDEGIRKAAERFRVAIQINRLGSMLTIFFAQRPVKDLASAKAADTGRFAKAAHSLRRAGVLISPSPFEAMFLSTAHTQGMVDDMVRAFSDACAQLS